MKADSSAISLLITSLFLCAELSIVMGCGKQQFANTSHDTSSAPLPSVSSGSASSASEIAGNSTTISAPASVIKGVNTDYRIMRADEQPSTSYTYSTLLNNNCISAVAFSTAVVGGPCVMAHSDLTIMSLFKKNHTAPFYEVTYAEISNGAVQVVIGISTYSDQCLDFSSNGTVSMSDCSGSMKFNLLKGADGFFKIQSADGRFLNLSNVPAMSYSAFISGNSQGGSVVSLSKNAADATNLRILSLSQISVVENPNTYGPVN